MAFRYSPKIITDGLVLYLDATNPKSIVSGSTTWNDLTTNFNNGTLVNGPTYSLTNSGNIVFDGTDDNIQLGNASKFISGSSITVDTWVKTNVTGSYKKIFFTGNQGTQTINGVYLSIGPSPFQTFFGVKTTTAVTAAYTTNISTNTYTNLTGTYDGTNVYLFVNGVLVAQQPQTGNINSSGIARISGYDNNTENWDGNIASFKIYNRTLSTLEIQQNYNTLKNRFGL